MTRVRSIATVLMVMIGLSAAAQAAPEVGKPAPQFELNDVTGNTHKLADYQGKVVVLHFQSMTCPWEKKYQPILNELARKYSHTEKDGEKVQQVVFLSINANKGEEPEQLKTWAEKVQVPYAVLKDKGNKVADLYAAKVTPHIYVIDGQGTLRYMGGVEKVPASPKQVGKSDEQYLEPAIQSLLNGSEIKVTESQTIGCGIKRE